MMMKRDHSLTVRRSTQPAGLGWARRPLLPSPPLSREAETRARSKDSGYQAGLERRQRQGRQWASVGVSCQATSRGGCRLDVSSLNDVVEHRCRQAGNNRRRRVSRKGQRVRRVWVGVVSAAKRVLFVDWLLSTS